MVVCSKCRLEIVGEAESKEKLYCTSAGEVISVVRHDSCAPAAGATLRKVDRSDLKTLLSPAMTRKNGLQKRWNRHPVRKPGVDTSTFASNAMKVKAS